MNQTTFLEFDTLKTSSTSSKAPKNPSSAWRTKTLTIAALVTAALLITVTFKPTASPTHAQADKAITKWFGQEGRFKAIENPQDLKNFILHETKRNCIVIFLADTDAPGANCHLNKILKIIKKKDPEGTKLPTAVARIREAPGVFKDFCKDAGICDEQNSVLIRVAYNLEAHHKLETFKLSEPFEAKKWEDYMVHLTGLLAHRNDIGSKK